MITRDLWPDEIVDDITSGFDDLRDQWPTAEWWVSRVHEAAASSNIPLLQQVNYVLITGEDFRVILQEIHMGSLSLAFSDRCSALRCYLVESIGLSFGHSLRLLWQECKLEAP